MRVRQRNWEQAEKEAEFMPEIDLKGLKS